MKVSQSTLNTALIILGKKFIIYPFPFSWDYNYVINVSTHADGIGGIFNCGFLFVFNTLD